MANEYKVPIIADEIYYDMTYEDDVKFTSFGHLSKDVPIIVIIGSLCNYSSVVVAFLKYIAFLGGD